MRNHDREARPAGAGGAGRSGRKRGKRRRWSVEEKIRIARESFASGETVTAVAARHGIACNRLSAWRGLLRRGKLSAPPPAKAREAFAVLEVEGRPSAVIEGRGVTVRLEGAVDAVGIASIAVALAGRR